MSYQELYSAAVERFNGEALDEAKTLAQQLVELEPSTIVGHILLGAILTKKDEFHEAIEVWEGLLHYEIGRNNYDVNHNLGLCYANTNQPEKTLECLVRAIQIDPSNITDHEIVGRILLQRGDHAKALSYIEKSFRSFPGRISMLNSLYAFALALNGSAEKAIEIYRPWWQQRVHGSHTRRAWYNFKTLEGTENIKAQSQRFEWQSEIISREFERIKQALELSENDSLLDIGGAGGLFAIKLAPLVKSVTLLDMSSALVDRAIKNVSAHSNILCRVADITKGKPAGVFDKALMASVTPVFSSPEALENALRNIHACMPPGGRCLVSNNYDITSADRYAAYLLRVIAPNKPVSIFFNMQMWMEEMFWIDIGKLTTLIERIGFASMQIINSRANDREQTMFDFLLVK